MLLVNLSARLCPLPEQELTICYVPVKLKMFLMNQDFV